MKQFILDLFRYPKFIQEELDYDKYWEDKKKDKLGQANAFQKERAHWIARHLEQDDSVLDIGCGDGSVLLEIMKMKKVLPMGTDVSKIALQILENQGIKSYHFDLRNENEVHQLPETDHILVLEVLEHLSNPELYLKKFLVKAKKNVFFSIPNSGYISHRLRLLFGRFPLQWRTHPGEHLRFWTLRDLNWWLRELQLEKMSQVHCYQGVPVLNNVCPSLFAKGIIVRINISRVSNEPKK